MKLQKVIVSAMLVFFVVSLNAGVRLNSLGSYFAYLIPDLETDSELFPSIMMQYDKSMVQISTNQTNSGDLPQKVIDFSYLYPKNKLRVKFDFDAGSNVSNPNLFLNDVPSQYYGNNYRFDPLFSSYDITSANIKTIVSYKFSKMILGGFLKFGKGWQDRIYENAEINLNYDYASNENNVDHDEVYFSAGINLNIKNWDITLNYNKLDIDFNDNEIAENYQDNYMDYYCRNNSVDVIKDSKTYSLAILNEKISDNNRLRLFAMFDYAVEDLDFDYEYSRYDSMESSGGYVRINQINETAAKDENRKVYRGTIGIAKSVVGKQFDTHFGCKLNGDWQTADRFEDSSYDQYYAYADSVNGVYDFGTESGSGENDFEINKAGLELQIPLGVVVHVSGKIDILGGAGLSMSYSKFDYYQQDNITDWQTIITKSFGMSYKPVENLGVDLYFNNTLSTYSNWQFALKYLW
ncbi:MAG: hypothetical protein Q7J16_00305 [Candidatus Cloacimonadales bacterium]|nr:hypothetical protein [Candidatus Cloacimonadales bacterium]